MSHQKYLKVLQKKEERDSALNKLLRGSFKYLQNCLAIPQMVIN